MDPFPGSDKTQSIYESSKTFSKPIPNQNRGHFLFPVFESLYKRFGFDNEFIVKLCRKHAGKVSSILDVGCSSGGLMMVLKKNFGTAIVNGIDIDPDAKIKAPEEIRDNIFIGDFLELEGEYDLIILKFVIEHLRDPVEYLRKAHSLLRRGGILFIATPDIESSKALQLKQDWDLIREKNRDIGHIVWFNKKCLYQISSQCNFKVSHWQRRGEIFYYFPEWVQRSLVKMLGRDPYRNRFIKSYPLRMIWALVFDCLLAETFGYGESMYSVLAKK
jgi:SAM-dependent methyltransferase